MNEENSNLSELSTNTSNITLDLSEDVVNDLLSKLNAFEKKKGFLDCDLTLNRIAKKFNSNTTYVSKAINYYRDISFANYLNSLRIDYAIKELKVNKTLRSYTINAISKEVGFNNAESFSKAFIKKTGIRPSYYIKQLNK